MVYEEVHRPLALALEGLEKAKRLFVCRLGAHFVTLAFAILSAIALHYGWEAIELGAAALAVVTEIIAFLFHHHAMELHSLGRQAMRRVMLLDALDPKGVEVVWGELKPRFDKGVHKKAEELLKRDEQLPKEDRRLPNYYWSDKPPGQARLRDHLFESAIFSQKLYVAAWLFSLLCMIVLFSIGATVAAFLTRGTTDLVVRVLITLVAFLPACQELDHMMLYRMMAHHLAGLVRRVQNLYAINMGTEEPDLLLMAEFGDYGAATTFAPPIRTWVYKWLARRLREQFAQKMRDLGQA